MSERKAHSDAQASADSHAPLRRVAVVYNPVKGDPEVLRKTVRHALRNARKASEAAGEAGWDAPMWLETTPDDAGHGLARQAREAGVDLVIAAGGDGTVRAVASGLRHTGIPLCIVPLGTGNLLARNLQLPLNDAAASVRIGLTGDTRRIDLGVAELTRDGGGSTTHYFLVMAGIGLDAAMIANTDPRLKKRVGWLAYIAGGVRSLTNEKLHLRYRLEGHDQHSAQVSTIIAGNCGVLQAGVQLMPAAELDDGQLDFAMLQPRNVFGWLLIWRAVTIENRVLRRTALGRRIIRFTGSEKARVVTYLRGPSIDVDLEGAEPTQLDGDEFGRITHARFWADAGALVVCVPAAAP